MSVREKLAEYAHQAWSGWMVYLFGKSTKNADGSITIPKLSVDRWERQTFTEYDKLPESEKESDRAEADKMLEIIEADNARLRQQLKSLVEAWNEFDEWKAIEPDEFPYDDYVKLSDAFLAVQSAQETEEK